jgi:hypothetical protein
MTAVGRVRIAHPDVTSSGGSAVHCCTPPAYPHRMAHRGARCPLTHAVSERTSTGLHSIQEPHAPHSRRMSEMVTYTVVRTIRSACVGDYQPACSTRRARPRHRDQLASWTPDQDWDRHPNCYRVHAADDLAHARALRAVIAVFPTARRVTLTAPREAS